MAKPYGAAVHGLPRDLYVVAGARGVAMLGGEIALTALLLRLYDQGVGGWGIAGLLAAGTVPQAVLAPLIGIAVDRFDSRALIMVSGLWQSVTLLSLMLVRQPVAALVLVALNTLGAALGGSVFAALTKVMVAEERLAKANSLQQGSNVIATVIGPPVGGLLTGLTGGAQIPLLIGVVSLLAITLSAPLITTRRRPPRTGEKRRVRAGVGLLFTDPAMGAVMVLAVLLILVGTAVGVAEVFLVRDTFRASTLVFGLLSATYTLGMLLGTAVSSRLDSVRRILAGIPVSATVMAVSLALIGLSRSLDATFVLYILAGAGTGVVSVSSGTLLLLRTPEPVLGRALASFTAVLRAAGLIAYVLGGIVVGLLPPDVVYTISGTAALVAVLVATPALRRAYRS